MISTIQWFVIIYNPFLRIFARVDCHPLFSSLSVRLMRMCMYPCRSARVCAFAVYVHGGACVRANQNVSVNLGMTICACIRKRAMYVYMRTLSAFKLHAYTCRCTKCTTGHRIDRTNSPEFLMLFLHAFI